MLASPAAGAKACFTGRVRKFFLLCGAEHKRNNWLYCGSDNGGATAAVLFSFIASCQRHKVNAFEYLRDVLNRIAAHSRNRLAELLPDRWKPAPAANPV